MTKFVYAKAMAQCLVGQAIDKISYKPLVSLRYLRFLRSIEKDTIWCFQIPKCGHLYPFVVEQLQSGAFLVSHFDGFKCEKSGYISFEITPPGRFSRAWLALEAVREANVELNHRKGVVFE